MPKHALDAKSCWPDPSAQVGEGTWWRLVDVAAGLDEGISSFCPPIFVYMENPYRDNK
jgi:hypothetical protein